VDKTLIAFAQSVLRFIFDFRAVLPRKSFLESSIIQYPSQ